MIFEAELEAALAWGDTGSSASSRRADCRRRACIEDCTTNSSCRRSYMRRSPSPYATTCRPVDALYPVIFPKRPRSLVMLRASPTSSAEKVRRDSGDLVMFSRAPSSRCHTSIKFNAWGSTSKQRHVELHPDHRSSITCTVLHLMFWVVCASRSSWIPKSKISKVGLH